MCEVRPGPRCASHARKQLASLNSAVTRLETQYQSCRDQETLYYAQNGRHSDALKRESDALAVRIDKTDKKRRLAQMDYDGTRTGSLELQSLIDSSTSSQKRVLVIRQKRAKMLRAWRENALARTLTSKNTASLVS